MNNHAAQTANWFGIIGLTAATEHYRSVYALALKAAAHITAAAESVCKWKFCRRTRVLIDCELGANAEAVLPIVDVSVRACGLIPDFQSNQLTHRKMLAGCEPPPALFIPHTSIYERVRGKFPTKHPLCLFAVVMKTCSKCRVNSVTHSAPCFIWCAVC